MKTEMLRTYIIIMTVMSAVAFIFYGDDKFRAKKGKWRIPEKTLFLVAILFGGPGAFLGMQIFRHKTKHIQFKIIIPLVTIIQIILGVIICVYM